MGVTVFATTLVVYGLITAGIIGIDVRGLGVMLNRFGLPPEVARTVAYELVLGIPFTVIPLYIYGRLTRRFGPKHDGETRCRKCGYILRGITEPRCPECGERI